jgi:hypothetical protein
MRFKDKVALITAAASGIGRATCDIIAREGGVRCRGRQSSGAAGRGGRRHDQIGWPSAWTYVRCARSVAGGRRGGQRDQKNSAGSTFWSTRSAAARSFPGRRRRLTSCRWTNGSG